MLVMPRLACPRLALDHDERDALVRHLNHVRVRVPQVVRREATPHARRSSRVMQLLACGRRLPAATGCRSVDHTQQRSDRELPADLEPRVELLPGPTVHPDLATLAAFATPHEHRTARAIQIALLQSERFADPQASASEQHYQRTKSVTVGTVPDGAHDSDDLLDGGRIGRILLSLVPRRAAPVVAGHRCR